MSTAEQHEHDAWDGKERRRPPPATHGARRSVADLALLAFAGVLLLAELAWLSFLAYAAARALD